MSLIHQTRNLLLFLLLGSLTFFAACNSQARGFVLPEGDAAAGKTAFLALECNQCHSIDAIPWKGEAEDVEVKLGGETTTIRTYGELVTSVINPSHRIANRYLKNKVMDAEGQSKMKIYNEVTTVQELVDIVTYLKSQYKIVAPPNPYPY